MGLKPEGTDVGLGCSPLTLTLSDSVFKLEVTSLSLGLRLSVLEGFVWVSIFTLQRVVWVSTLRGLVWVWVLYSLS